jgi:hypothetical protein
LSGAGAGSPALILEAGRGDSRLVVEAVEFVLSRVRGP